MKEGSALDRLPIFMTSGLTAGFSLCHVELLRLYQKAYSLSGLKNQRAKFGATTPTGKQEGNHRNESQREEL